MSLLILVGGLITSFLLTFLARKIAPKIGWLDHPSVPRKSQATAIPLLGGAAIFLTFVLWHQIAVHFHLFEFPPATSFIGLILSMGLMTSVGLYDDRWPLRASTKLVLQFISLVPYLLLGDEITSVVAFGFSIENAALVAIFKAIWILACINIINLLDGIDGLVTTTGLVLCGTMAVLMMTLGIPSRIGPESCLIMLGALLGFLPHNWSPAKIYLGDAGSLLIGFFIATSTFATSDAIDGSFLPIPYFALLGLPVFDTSVAILRRRLKRRPIGQGDAEHVHHVLRNRGCSTSQATLVLTSISAVFAMVASASIVFSSDYLAISGFLLVCGFLIATRIFGHNEWALVKHQLQKRRFRRRVRRLMAQGAITLSPLSPNNGLRLYDPDSDSLSNLSISTNSQDGETVELEVTVKNRNSGRNETSLDLRIPRKYAHHRNGHRFVLQAVESYLSEEQLGGRVSLDDYQVAFAEKLSQTPHKLPLHSDRIAA